ncbi:MAG: alpha-amylase family glycosyl hydrolase [Acutalibacteraceae bacterium]|nr:alpha-amylase family glycosyl hydrolase [Acutalibacteraceae bacterium]
MNSLKRVIAIALAVMMVVTCGIITANAATTDVQPSEAGGITIHYYGSTTTPSIYYWNSLPTNIDSPNYPGMTMSRDTSAAGPNCYKYSFSNVTKINFLFVENGTQSAELTREYREKSQGDWWYYNNKWYSRDPFVYDDYERTDLREDSIYFIITTRFYDGDKGNNVHCWDDKQANNPDSDPAWRGDFKGLIQKLDYLKALGFSAIWITPVVNNASGYDYHGYHSFDFATVDPRYESSDTTYEDLIAAAHDKGMKIVQDVVWNHTGNFGDPFLAPMFTKEYNTIQDLASADCMKVIPGSDLAKNYSNYESLQPGAQFQARLDCMKAHVTSSLNSKEYYHREKNMGYESSIEQQGSMAGDCVDINTENPVVAKYITDTYLDYANLGVDAFRLDTEKHINRWTLNNAYFPAFSELKSKNFHIFGEVCSRVRETWNHNIPSSSPAFFTWAETESAWKGNWNNSDPTANIKTSIAHYDAHRSPEGLPTTKNAFLNGNEYHTPDYSQSNGTSVIDFTMHWNFQYASSAYGAALAEDSYMNDSTWNVVYVDSHDYGPDGMEKTRYSLGTQAWAENFCLIFTFRGIPCVYYGSEVEFAKDMPIDVGPNQPLSTTGRAYFGDHLEGSVSATDFGQYTASGEVQKTLNSTLSQHLIKLNQIRRAVPALQKGQYTSVGDMCFKRGYTDPDTGEKSFACVAVTNGATFSGIPNGTYIDAVTGDTKNVTNGSLSVSAPGKGNCRVYVLSSNGYKGISGKIGGSSTYLK